jgi:two-component system sensor histidine kinase TctE
VTADLLPKAVALQKDLGFEGPDRAVALSDEVLLGELLRNLVDNAITHCPADTMITVHVAASSAEWLRLVVVDTGPPITDADLIMLTARIDPESRPGEARTGTRGLGLHIVAEIARALHAGLQLERGEDRKGLAWSVSLPTGRSR